MSKKDIFYCLWEDDDGFALTPFKDFIPVGFFTGQFRLLKVFRAKDLEDAKQKRDKILGH